MSILIKNAKIISPGQDLHHTKKDILIKNGQIEKIANRITANTAKKIESTNLHVSPGWLDIGTNNSEPGYEHRESLESLSATAAAGGYTALATFPNTLPVIDNRSSIQYILNTTKEHLVDYYPIGAISKGCLGQEITEMMDMNAHGAVAYSDGLNPVASSGLMMRALDYVKGIDSLVIHHPEEASLSYGNQIHEGKVSTELGLKGSPHIAELLTLDRDLRLTDYTSSKLLVYNISSQESVRRLKGLSKENIYTAVSYLNLCLTDEAIYGYKVNMKVRPPLRTKADKEALVKGVKSADIQIISSNHQPLEIEAKRKEFPYALAGAIGLQTCFGGIITHCKELNLDNLVACLSINPRKILGLSANPIVKSSEADLTLFDPSKAWTLDDKTNLSKSKNSPFWNQQLTGSVIAVIKGKKSHINKY